MLALQACRLTASLEVVEEVVEVSMTPPPPPSSSELPTKGRLLRRSSPLLTFSSDESATQPYITV